MTSGSSFSSSAISQALLRTVSIARTLQRRLGAEGTSFRELVDLARRDIALQAVRKSAANLAELSFLLGFSEISAFSRAFRRWTGHSPTEYLRQDRGGRAGAASRIIS